MSDGWKPVDYIECGGPFIDGPDCPSFIYEQYSLDGTLLSKYGLAITFPELRQE